MIFPNWTGWKTVKAVLFVAGGLVPLLPEQYRTIASAVVAAIGSLVVALSGTNAGPPMLAQRKS